MKRVNSNRVTFMVNVVDLEIVGRPACRGLGTRYVMAAEMREGVGGGRGRSESENSEGQHGEASECGWA